MAISIILASKSPRRKEILENLGLKFDVVTADADESSDIREPGARVMALAEKKGLAVVDKLGDCTESIIIACDTLVYCNGEFLGKPKNREDAERMIKMLEGNSHEVISGIFLSYKGKGETAYASTKVIFDSMTDADIEAYLNTDEPYDKAGAYAIQGLASAHIKGIEGDYFNVVGLPVNVLCNTLKEKFGIDINALR